MDSLTIQAEHIEKSRPVGKTIYDFFIWEYLKQVEKTYEILPTLT